MGCGCPNLALSSYQLGTKRDRSDSDGTPLYFLESNRFDLRMWRSFRAFCLGVTGFTNPPIGEALVTRHAQEVFGALCIADL